MRLRLTVQRNGLPAANILWHVSDANNTPAYTIARLLDDVSHIIPLEAEHWGMEHYVVEVGGFECLHFSPVVQALKEDDHVSIRPLMTAEVRARTLTGRHQISDDGRHLVDGVPFGRPYLRHPRRPAVRIPPRKRQRLDDSNEAEVAGLEGVVRQLIMDSTMAGSEQGSTAGSAAKTVQFKDTELIDDDDSDEDDSDFAEDNTDGADNTTDDELEDGSDLDSDSDSDSSSASNDSSTSSDSLDDTSSDSESDSESDASSPPEVKSSKGVLDQRANAAPQTPQHVVPGHGSSATRSRNSRRTRSNRLRHLKEAGKLPPDADLKTLERYETNVANETMSAMESSTPFSSYTGKRKRVDEDEADEVDIREDVTELEQRKQALMARFDEEQTHSIAEAKEPFEEVTISQGKDSSNEVRETEKLVEEKPKKRLRPDTSAIGRILARQAMQPLRKSTKAKQPADPPEPEGASDPDFWKSKINLSAFECWEEDFELSAPPFPFQQHWDPASKIMREKADKKKQKKKRSRESVVVEEEDEEEERLVLDYDDAGAVENADAQIHAAIEDQLLQDVAIAAQADLPPLPEDISTLPNLNPGDIREGAIIVCKFFAVNTITITPEVSDFKTAVVHREGDSGNGAGTIQLKIAARDLPRREKKFDSKGNRIYDAVDQFYVDGDEQDEDLWEGQFSELLEPKLPLAA